MDGITDFYQFKYKKNDYYIDLIINREVLVMFEDALNERLSDLNIPKDSQCAYMRLKELFQRSRMSSNCVFINIQVNKCYLKYLKNLYYYFIGRNKYTYLKILNDYLHPFLIEDIERISQFGQLDEDIKIRILSNV